MRTAPVLGVCIALAVSSAQARDGPGRGDRFDLICHVVGRVVAQPHVPPTGTNVGRYGVSRMRLHISVDLSRGWACDRDGECPTTGPVPPPEVTRHQLTMLDIPGNVWRIDLSTGRSRQEIIEGETATVISGYCTRTAFSLNPHRAPFTGFPLPSPHPRDRRRP
jgi:hypothetical protein